MSNIPGNYRFAKSHEWVMDNGDGTVTVGISHHAQELLGDVVFVELPEVGREVDGGEEFSLVESVKAASDIYCPVAGEILEVNEALEDAPETVNEFPYSDGWIARLRVANPADLDELLDAAAYAEVVAESE